MHVPVLLCYGTLLGWYRHCGTIPFSNDMDISIDFADIRSDEHYDLIMVREHACVRLFELAELHCRS